MSEIEKEIIRLLAENIKEVNASVNEMRKEAKNDSVLMWTELNQLKTSVALSTKQAEDEKREIDLIRKRHDNCIGELAMKEVNNLKTQNKLKDKDDSSKSSEEYRIGSWLKTAAIIAGIITGIGAIAYGSFEFFVLIKKNI